MSVAKITKSVVDRLGQGEMIWDAALSGFGVRRQTKHPHYLVRYRVGGRQRYVTIGKHGAFTPDTARRKAMELLGQIAAGKDPQAEEANASAETFGAILDHYLAHKARTIRPRSFREVQRHLRHHAAPLHSLPFAEINRRTIAQRLGEIEARSGIVPRNRVRASLSAFFRWGIREGLIDVNPVAGTAHVSEGGGRERVLSEAEIGELWAGLGNDPHSDIVRLLLLTGQRREEFGGLRWSEVDLARAMIVFPAARTKNKRQHELPLSRQALAILSRQPKGEFVFGPFGAWSLGKGRLDARLALKPWRLHDLRRSFATHCVELGVLPHVVEAILNHQSGSRRGPAGIYNRSKLFGPMFDALQLWADHVEALIVGPRKQPVPTGLMERAFAVARGGKIVPIEDLANLARQLKNKVMQH
jgi:integrase